jgi:hypothetical protein
MTAGLVLAFLGYLLVWAAVKGVHPWAPIVEAFGGTIPPAPGASINPQGGVGTEPYGPPTQSGGLTPAALAAKAAIEQTYPNLTYRGGFVCRHEIPHSGQPSEDWSEHAWGNAIDFGEPGQEADMRKLMVWATLNKLRYRIVNIIGPGSAVVTVHLDFAPSHDGQTPPCAGSA